MKSIQKILTGEKETIDFARSVARYVVTGDIIRLEGTLGMGKSTFARAFIQELAGAEITVPSPTFTIVQTYEETRLPVAHVDAYRLTSGADMEGLDLYDYFEHGITLIEWPQNIEDALPEKTIPEQAMIAREESDILTVRLENHGEDGRLVTIEACGTWAQRFGLVMKRGADRPVTEEGRKKFLTHSGLSNIGMSAVCGALSFRTYWRVQTPSGPRILMDAPPPMEDVKPFVDLQKVYASASVHVPAVDAEDIQNGYLLLEDFGSTPLSALENEEEQKVWLEACVDMLLRVQKLPQPKNLKIMDFDTVFEEAVRYMDWYLPYEVNHATDMGARTQFQMIWQKLYKVCTSVPSMVTHWDFHSDNLMKITNNPSVENIGVLDFQDALWAPVSFDLACLLEDRWTKPLSAELKMHLIQRFVDGLDGVDMAQFMASYHICTLFRMLKITGLYNRASKRDGRTDLPWDMDLIWHGIATALEQPECLELKGLMNKLSPNQLKECA